MKHKINKNQIWLTISLSILSISSIIGIILCDLLPLWLTSSAIGLVIATAFFSWLCYHNKKSEWCKTLLVLSILWLVVVGVYIFCEKTGFVEIFIIPAGVVDGEALIQQRLVDYIESTGSWAVLVFIALQFLQTTILPIPSFATTGTGSLLFTEIYGGGLGPLYNSLFSLIGILLGSFVAFGIGRIFGSRLVAWIIGQKQLDKTLNMIKGKDTILLSAMFILPFFPDDILCFVAGLCTMSTKYFAFIIILSRVLIVFCTSYLFGLIPLTTWWGLSIWAIFILIIIGAFLLIIKHREKLESIIEQKFTRKNYTPLTLNDKNSNKINNEETQNQSPQD